MSPELLLTLSEEAKSAFAEKDLALAEAEKRVVQRDEKIAQMEAQLAWFRKYVYGPRSEKNVIPPPPDSPQLDVFAEGGEATAEEIREETKAPEKDRHRARKETQGRKALPEKLARTIIMHDLSEEEKTCTCCGKAMCLIGEDVTEKLEVVPARVHVARHVRPRYACGGCKDAVAQAPLPAFPIPRAAAGASLLAFLMLSKYADHTPLCRIERIFARHGIDLPRRKTSEWMMEIADLLRPLVSLMQRRIVERSALIGVDETTIQMLDPGSGKGKTKRCYLWQYRGDGNAPYTAFDFRDGRGREGPKDILRDYGGFLQCDDYSVYTCLRTREKLGFTQVGCWAHARRKFAEAFDAGDKRAEEAVLILRDLYAVEKEAREQKLDAEGILELRREKSLPVLARLKEWMQAQLAVLPQSPLGKAIGYALDNWRELTVYTTDGRIPIDNNAVERAIRPVALGRKNWLFAGSERGGEAAAIFFSLIETARRADVNLWDYVTDLLTRIPTHPINRLEELLPDTWKPPSN